ncbi:MAG: DUF3541 domain-containing protein [Candidatus Zixiibacteriota bacterium]
MARRIRQTFESDLYRLEPGMQRHFAQRMYRITGDERYAYPLFLDYLILEKNLQATLDSLHNRVWVDRQMSRILDRMDDGGRKGRLRRQMFEHNGDMALYLEMLRAAYALEDYGVCSTGSLGLCGQAVVELGKVDLPLFLLDTAVIRVYSAQAVNGVYYMYQLRLGDFRTEYASAFRQTFPDDRDAELSDLEFGDKIYGLTHFVTAASNYYQKPVDSAEFNWILGYFELRQARILHNLKADIVAEVGLCFLLAGQDRHLLVDQCRKIVLDEFDPGSGIVPSPAGNTDLDLGEHRNILAYMLLEWPRELHPGPRLPDLGSFQTIFYR